jgi:type IV pilus assembly protein PilX
MEQAMRSVRAQPPRLVCAPPRRQRGVVLFIALIVMVVMTLGALALVRSVDTANLVIGNLAFRQASVNPANYAIEAASASLFTDANNGGAMVADVRANDANTNYYSTYDPAAGWDNKFGIPQPLQTKKNAQKLKVQLTDQANNTITYVIERMCNPNAPKITADFSPSLTWCDMLPPKQSPGTTVNDPALFPFPNLPFYRVTVRVDGPNNTTSFVQATLR